MTQTPLIRHTKARNARLRPLGLLPLIYLVMAGACAETDEWDRSLQCSDRAAAMMQLEHYNGSNTQKPVLAWSNHYNRSSGRCVVQTEIQNFAADVSNGIPFSYSRLHDVLEKRILATCTRGTVGDEDLRRIYCNVAGDESSAGDCQACRAFIETAMSN